MGRLIWVTSMLLAAAVGSSALDCNIGTVVLDKQGKTASCPTDFCMRRSPELPNGQTMHILGCGDPKNMETLKVHDMCTTERCNRIPGVLDDAIKALPAEEDDVLADMPYCYVGIAFNGSAYVGAQQPCPVPCASTNVTAFFCASEEACNSMVNFTGGAQKCGDPTIYPFTVCCCNDQSNCNIAGWNITAPSPSPVSTRIPQACYAGIHIGDKVLSGGTYIACQGDCASLRFQLASHYDFSIFQCDPISTCRALGLTNDCLNVTADGSFSGCCCNFDACIDPTTTPPRYPFGRRGFFPECYVGLHLKNMTTGLTSDYGATAECEGQCGRLKTVLNGFETEVFFCATNNLCYGLDIVDGCTNMTISGANVEICCCMNGPNCNTRHTDITPMPSIQPARTNEVIACYEGLHINNQTYSGTFTSCLGDCVSLSVRTLVAGSQINITLLTCDPSTVCTQLGIYNRCANIANTTVSGCCCDTDVCIDPRVHKLVCETCMHVCRYPNGTDGLHCAVGLSIFGGQGEYSSVYQMPCDGECANAFINSANLTAVAYFCAPRSSCEALALHNQCATILGTNPQQSVRACCCDLFSICNYDSRDLPPPTYSPPSTKPPIACLSGFMINSIGAGDKYIACQGDCGLVNFEMAFAGTVYNTTMFTCDPAAFCPYFGIANKCHHSPDYGLSACCCDWNDCIDPANRTIRARPTISAVQCFVGLQFSAVDGVTTYGDYMACDGLCGTLQTTINRVVTSGFFCSPASVCSSFEVFDDCTTRFMDRTDFMKVCCCSEANCNGQTNGYNISVPSVAPITRRTPISCYSGLSFIAHGTYYNLSSEDQYMSCFGDCVRISYFSMLDDSPFIANMFTCDSIDVCTGLGMSNSCTNITSTSTSSGIGGCCCNFNDCLNKHSLSINPQERKSDLQCFVGMQLQSSPLNVSSRVLVGSTMTCSGECAAVATVFNGYSTWAFACLPQASCDFFDRERTCGMLNFDAGDYLETCCCSRFDNCNLHAHHIDVPTVLPSVVPNTTSPIACYAGVTLNGVLYSAVDAYMACLGNCAQITYKSTIASAAFSASIMSCDPVATCALFGLSNSCTVISNGNSSETAINACCCDFNDCIDHTTLQIKTVPTTTTTSVAAALSVCFSLLLSALFASPRYDIA